jgi:hypothetical protein
MSYDYPRCSACKQEKARSEFYPRGNSGYVTSECKVCMKLRSKNTHKVDRKVSLVQSENDVIEALTRIGIPALPGKALHQQWADVIAFGAVLIEVKSSKDRSGQYGFNFTHSQRHGKLRGDIVVLVCKDDENSFHVFPSNHPMFFMKNGKMRSTLTYTPNRKNGGRKSVLTDAMMAEAQDNWQLVHDYLRQISDRLRFGAQLPILLNAA